MDIQWGWLSLQSRANVWAEFWLSGRGPGRGEQLARPWEWGVLKLHALGPCPPHPGASCWESQDSRAWVNAPQKASREEQRVQGRPWSCRLIRTGGRLRKGHWKWWEGVRGKSGARKGSERGEDWSRERERGQLPQHEAGQEAAWRAWLTVAGGLDRKGLSRQIATSASGAH